MENVGVFIDILLELEPKLYSQYLVSESEIKILYVQFLNETYRVLNTSILCWNKFWKIWRTNDLYSIHMIHAW